MYAVSHVNVSCARERGESDQRRQMAALVSSLPLYSQSSPSLAPIIPRISYVGNLVTKKFEKPFGSNLITRMCCGRLHVSAHARNAAVAGWTLER